MLFLRRVLAVAVAFAASAYGAANVTSKQVNGRLMSTVPSPSSSAVLCACPAGWTEGTTCNAPASYTGPCNNPSQFSGYDDNGKVSWAQSCGATWTLTCNGDLCPCPDFWIPTTCTAPASYSGSCNSVSVFTNYNDNKKLGWGISCDASWNICASGVCSGQLGTSSNDGSITCSACPANSIATGAFVCGVCPSGWTPSGAQCVAPASYTGSCNHVSTFSGYDNAAKLSWARSCGASWNQGLACPDGWTPTACNAPSSYAGPCNSLSYFNGYSAQDKLNWAASCGTTWNTCSSACAACPAGTHSNDGVNCARS